jgi:hypothetical protein
MDRFLVCAAYWIVCSRWHGGQNSHAYKKLSHFARMRYEPGLASWAESRGSDERQAAAALLNRLRKTHRLEL